MDPWTTMTNKVPKSTLLTTLLETISNYKNNNYDNDNINNIISIPIVIISNNNILIISY